MSVCGGTSGVRLKITVRIVDKFRSPIDCRTRRLSSWPIAIASSYALLECVQGQRCYIAIRNAGAAFYPILL